jgi:hypothetical protein
MELYKSKLEFNTDILISEINANFNTGSVSNDNLKMENYQGAKHQFDKMEYFNKEILSIFEGFEFDNIFLFFAQPTGGLYWHKDGGSHYRRFIFPIVSNEKCINHFKIDEVEHSMRFTDGTIHWFDSQKIEHTVINSGDTTRVAFLFDVLYKKDEFEKLLEKSFNKTHIFE